MENKNIIVTGGLGFIGSHIVDELVENNKVTIIDNLSTGKMENLKKPEHPNLTLIKGDLNDLELKPILEGNEYIFHLAAAASVPMSVENPMNTHINNVDATAKLLIAAKDAGIKKIVFSSSSAVYGENPNMPLKETEPYMPTSPYAASKAIGELYLKSFTESYGLNSTSLRYFNVFGRKQDPNGAYAAVIPKFVMQLMQHESPVINGDGNYSRDFTYIDNVIQMNELAMTTTQPEAINTVFNTAFGDRNTLNDLVGYLKAYLGEYDEKF